MKKFKVSVTRIDEYEIEVDETIYEDPQWIKDFEKSFWPHNGCETVAADLAVMQARHGSGSDFIEGYGYICRDGELPFSSFDFDETGKWKPDDQRRKPAPGLNIVIISEDDNISYDIIEITNPQ